MTPQLVDHVGTDSCIVIGCNLLQPRRKLNTLISGRSHVTVIVDNALRRAVSLRHQSNTKCQLSDTVASVNAARASYSEVLR